MTNSPPPNPDSSSNSRLGFDEFIGILVAFSTIGAILFLTLAQKNQVFNPGVVSSPSPSTLPSTIAPSPNE